MKKILYIVLLLPFLSMAQAQNYIKTTTQRDSANTATQRVDVTYFDGLGRPIQKVLGKMSATGTDVVTHIEYDGFNRQVKEYLPFPTQSTNQDFVSDALTPTLQYYASTTNVQDTTSNPYSEQFLEASPLGRVLKRGAPGAAWKGHTGTNNNDHTVKFAYQTNTDNEVKMLSVTAALDANNIYGTLTLNGTSTYYPAGALYKTITKDENWTSTSGSNNTVEEFKNKEGLVILKVTYDAGVKHLTYYVYDQFGNLTYVLPPLMNGSNANMENLGYQYKYDGRNRLVEKKLPGKQWEFIVYDPLDRPVLSGPVFSPFPDLTGSGWIMTIYDANGRVAMTGWYSATITSAIRKTAQTAAAVVNAVRGSGTVGGVSVGYNALTSPPSGLKLLTVNYYDDYNWPNAPTFPIIVETQKTRSKAKGLQTGSWMRVLDAQANTTGTVSYTLYDNKSRAVRNSTANYLGGYTQVDSKLDFDGSPLKNVTSHKRLSGSPADITVEENFTYTSQDRLLNHTHKIGNLAAQTLSNNTYNALGELTTKKVGNGNIAGTGWQTINYKYNIRGWLTDINDINNLGTDLFAFKIAYNTVTDPVTGFDPLYNGNISETYWKTSTDNIKRKYSYKYDNLNRLKHAFYQKPGTTPAHKKSYDEKVSYDKNGNILSLVRYGGLDDPITAIAIDSLIYTYPAGSNRLDKVYDYKNSPQGFKDNYLTSTDYSYDANGNMTVDNNKGITNIKYNHLNLPVEINFGSTNKIIYLYDASGKKLKKTVTEVVSGTTTTVYVDYLDGFQYKGGVLQFFPTAEGYVDNTVSGSSNVYNYVFQYKDHLGNARVNYSNSTDKNGVTATRIKEENHYYPFGLKHLNYNMDYLEYQEIEGDIVLYPPLSATGKLMNNYRYLGQERQDELGLNWDTFRYRNYDFTIGRFMSIDPISEKFYSISNYQFAHNNPVWKIELEGLEGQATTGRDVINTEAPDDIRITATLHVTRSINAGIDHVGDKMGYSNLSSSLKSSHADEVNVGLVDKGTEQVNRGTTSVTTDTQIRDSGIIFDTDVSITTEVSSISIFDTDNIAAGSAGTNTTGNSQEGSFGVDVPVEGGGKIAIGLKGSNNQSTGHTTSTAFHMYTGIVFFKVTVKGQDANGDFKVFSTIVPVKATFSTSFDLKELQELKNVQEGGGGKTH